MKEELKSNAAMRLYREISLLRTDED